MVAVNQRALNGEAAERARHWLAQAVAEAGRATCLRRRCGTVIVAADDVTVIGRGVNGLPGTAGQSCVHCAPYQLAAGFKSDKTCCVHAEQRAVMDLLRHGHAAQDATLYFASVDDGGQALPSGKPYCTICSKMALDAGIGGWVLDHAEGPVWYAADHYNQLSFAYDGEGR